VTPLQAFVDRYYDEPVLFVQEILGQDPDEWQAKSLMAIARRERKISIRSGHGVGKSTFASWAAIWFVCTRYTCKVVITAPTSSQLYDALFAELKAQMKKLPEHLYELFDVKTDRVEHKAAPQEVFISARTSRAEQPEAMQGIHADNVLLIADEASGVPEAVFEAAVGSMSGQEACTLLLGNPTQSSGLFYDTHHRLKGEWWTLRVSCEDSSRVSKDFIEEVRNTYGENSNAFRVRVLGEFPLADDDTVIPISLLEAAKVRDIRPSMSAVMVWGLDVARFGADRTVLTKRKGSRLHEMPIVKRNLDTMQVSGLVLNEWNETPAHYRPVEICVDVIGLGAGVVDRLTEMGLPIVAVNVGEAPAMNDKFLNLRAELWFRGKDWFEKRNAALNLDGAKDNEHGLVEKLIDELAMVRYSYTSNGKIKVESKDDIKKRTRDKSSPDLADSFLLTLAGQHGISVAATGTSAYGWNKPVRRNRASLV
jgi:phage terminase large subunit